MKKSVQIIAFALAGISLTVLAMEKPEVPTKKFNPSTLKEAAMKPMIAEINRLAKKRRESTNKKELNEEIDRIVNQLRILPVELQIQIFEVALRDIPEIKRSLPGQWGSEMDLSADYVVWKDNAENLLAILRSLIGKSTEYAQAELLQFLHAHEKQLFYSFPMLVLREDRPLEEEQRWIKELLKGATDQDKFEALYYLCRKHNATQALEFLLKNGVDPNVRYNGRTLLSYIKEKQKEYELLVPKQTHPGHKEAAEKAQEKYTQLIKLLQKYGAHE